MCILQVQNMDITRWLDYRPCVFSIDIFLCFGIFYKYYCLWFRKEYIYVKLYKMSFATTKDDFWHCSNKLWMVHWSFFFYTNQYCMSKLSLKDHRMQHIIDGFEFFRIPPTERWGQSLLLLHMNTILGEL